MGARPTAAAANARDLPYHTWASDLTSGGSTACWARLFFEDFGFRQFFPLYINTLRPLRLPIFVATNEFFIFRASQHKCTFSAADLASGKTRILPRPPDFHIPTFPLIAFLPDHAELECTNIGPRPCNTSSAPHPHTAVCGPKLTCRASDRFTISDLNIPQYCIDGIRSSSFDTRLLRRPVSFFVV